MKEITQLIRLLKILALITAISSCKFQPNLIRSQIHTTDAFEMIQQGSTGFRRAPDRTSGNFFFTLRGPYSCQVDYWADDLSITPNSREPLSLLCPKDERSPNIRINDLDAGVSYSFRVTVWPQGVRSGAGAVLIFRESPGLADVKTSHLVVARYVAPRRSSEIYTFQFEGETDLMRIRNEYIDHYSRSGEFGCSKDDLSSTVPFPRTRSSRDSEQRPLHDLENVSSDGYARAIARPHPFFPTRLTQYYAQIERLANWEWNFTWQEQKHKFEVYPPGFFDSISIHTGENRKFDLNNRLLGSAVPEVELNGRELTIEASSVFPGDLSFIHLRLNDPLKANREIYCSFPATQDKYTIPENLYSELPEGGYDFTAVFESIQIQFRSGTPYPPWIISSQDWVHTRIKKRF